jgi:hypothetical protein
MGAYDWEEERGTFARAAKALGEERTLDLLDQAAEAASSGDLRKAAGILEELRAAAARRAARTGGFQTETDRSRRDGKAPGELSQGRLSCEKTGGRMAPRFEKPPARAD